MINITAPFAYLKTMEKVGYCNRNIIPRLKELKIYDWDMDTRRIIFRGRRFPMKYIDDGKAEEFIESLVESNGQTKLDMWGAFDF